MAETTGKNDQENAPMSQADIEALLEGRGKSGGGAPKKAAQPVASSKAPPEDGSSILSPDEIDAMFKSPRKASGEVKAEAKGAVEDGASILSPDEIDQLFQPKKKKAVQPVEPSQAPPEDGSSILSPDEIDQLFDPAQGKKGSVTGANQEKQVNVVSAEDIDALFKAAPTDKIITPTLGSRDTSLDDDLVLVRPDDIARLLNGQDDDLGSDSGESIPALSDKQEVDDLLNADDVDHLFSASLEEPATLPEPLDEEELVPVSQEDIDQLLKNALGDTPDSSMSAEGDMAGHSGPGLISKDDIDDLLSHTLDADEEIGLVTQDDIDDLLQGAFDKNPVPSEPGKDRAPSFEKSDVEIPKNGISASPVMIEEKRDDEEEEQPSLFITQEAIDGLLKEAKPPKKQVDRSLDRVSRDSTGPLVKEGAGRETPEPEIETPPDADFEGLVSQDELDSLLAGSADKGETRETPEEENSGLISQDDINELMSKSEKEPDADEEEPSLISQDDIDQLLAIEVSDEKDPSEGVSEQGEETGEVSQDVIDKLLEEETGTSEDEAGLVTQDIIDQLLNEEIEEEESVDKEEKDQVILEEVKEDDEGVVPEKKSSWYRSKILWSVMVGIVTLGVSIFSAVTMKPPISGHGDGPQILHFTIVPEPAPKQEGAPVAAEPEKNVMVSTDFNGFVVMAPSGRKDIVYVQADLTVDLSKESASQVKAFEPYYRNIIYDVLAQAMKHQEGLALKKAELQDSIKSALNDALTDKTIERVTFTRFALI